LRDKIRLCRFDAIEFLRTDLLPNNDRSQHFIYLDPPYYVKGSRLYLNYYEPKDHAALAQFLRRIKNVHWLVTYDNTPEIRKLYDWSTITDFQLQYSAASPKQGNEIMIPSPDLVLPISQLRVRSA
jgi:DNA adenine methylase